MQRKGHDAVDAAIRSGVFTTLFLSLPVIAFVVDEALRLRFVDGAGLRDVDRALFDERDPPLGGIDVLSLVTDPESSAAFAAALRGSLAGRSERTGVRVRDLWYDISLSPIYGGDGRAPIGVAGVALNVSTERRAKDALVSSDANLRASRVARLAWWHYDLRSGALTLSPSLERRRRPTSDPAADRDALIALVHPDDREPLRTAILDAVRYSRPSRGFDYRLLEHDGSYRWLLQQIELVSDEHGRTIAVEGILLDITERKLLEEHLRRLAHVDGLTGLANRTRLTERLKDIAVTVEAGRDVALFFIDVDGFKAVNDTYGHDAGDRLLKQIAERISGAVGPGAFVARSGGDEFVVIISPAGDRSDVRHVAEQIGAVCAAPFHVADRELFISLSIGVSVAPDEASTGEALLRNADSALYAAKAAGRNNHRFFTRSMHASAARRLVLENDLRRAAERDELWLAYQPIVSADGSVHAVEALARWRHGKLGAVAPSIFIPIAEQSGMIRAIGAHVADKACRALRLLREFAPDLRLALNISAHQLDWNGLIPMLSETLARSGLDFGAMEIELTETVVMREVGRAAGVLRDLKARGARISIDDFGTGYSSLAWLRDLPIDTIKIDRSFVDAIVNEPESSLIVGSIVTLGNAMNLQVVAEGVESDEQIERLRKLGCRLFQGYAFSRPVDAERLPTILAALARGERHLAAPRKEESS